MKTLQEQRTESVLKMQERIIELESGCGMCYRKDKEQLTKAKEIIKELYEGLDKLYLSGLSDKQIAFVERLQDKTEQFLKEIK